jgi:outer membrane protein OmpA-like peptidoglycan-associated protein
VTYNVPSADDSLSDLVVSGVTLSPVFDPTVFAYTASVANSVASVTVTPTTTSSGATVTVDSVAVVSSAESLPISLNVGVNEIEVEVTASDPRFSQTYTVTLTRAAPIVPPSPTGGGVSPGIPVDPPANVVSGSVAGAVTVNGVMETGVVLVRTPSDSGWEALGSDFQLSVETESTTGSPEPLTPIGVMQVPQGGRIVINGDGYLPDSQVAVFAIPRTIDRMSTKIWARSMMNATYIASTTVSATGTVSATMFVPADMNLGDYVLQVNGETDLAQIRSVNLLMNVIPAPAVMQAGMIREAAFYQGKSTKLSDSGKQRLRTMVKAIPVGAQDVSVAIVGVSVSLGTATENLDLARDRAERIVKYLQSQGVSGEYTVSISTTFTVDAAERSLSGDMKNQGMDKPMKSSTGKPLTTASISFEAPLSN